MKVIPIRLTSCNNAVGNMRSLSYLDKASGNGVSAPSMQLISVVASCSALVTPIPDQGNRHRNDRRNDQRNRRVGGVRTRGITDGVRVVAFGVLCQRLHSDWKYAYPGISNCRRQNEKIICTIPRHALDNTKSTLKTSAVQLTSHVARSDRGLSEPL